MNAALGHTGVYIALGAVLTGAAVLCYGLVRSKPELVRAGRVYGPIALAGAVLATIAMQRALVTHDFSIVFVAQNNSRVTPLLYSITGMWSALAGSILLWGLILTGYIAAMTWRFRRHGEDPLVGWATLVTYLIAAFFFGLMAGPADPFRTVSGPAPQSGLGPNVLLQNNALVAFHPPLLYLGFVGFSVPFAFRDRVAHNRARREPRPRGGAAPPCRHPARGIRSRHRVPARVRSPGRRRRGVGPCSPGGF